jgi:hypothetical protein
MIKFLIKYLMSLVLVTGFLTLMSLLVHYPSVLVVVGILFISLLVTMFGFYYND